MLFQAKLPTIMGMYGSTSELTVWATEMQRESSKARKVGGLQ